MVYGWVGAGGVLYRYPASSQPEARLRLILDILLDIRFIRPFDWDLASYYWILDTGYWIPGSGPWIWTLDTWIWTLDLVLDLALDWS